MKPIATAFAISMKKADTNGSRIVTIVLAYIRRWRSRPTGLRYVYSVA